ncbi:MAG: PHB depolymerase family esterase [Pirellulaceae bacterium]
MTRRAFGLLAVTLFGGIAAVMLSPGGKHFPPMASADTITLNSGVQLEGKIGEIGDISQNPLQAVAGGESTGVKQIVIVDDDLRRVYVPALQVRAPGVVPSGPRVEERIAIEQRVAVGGRRIGSVGAIIGVEPFDPFGRRIFSLNSNLGRTDIVQGITQITPRYTKVEGLLGRSPIVWDMRIATSSIPRDTLSNIIKNNIDVKDPDDRLSIVRLYTQAHRFSDARKELDEVLKEFPDLAELEKQLQALRQLEADRAIDEIELRRDSGQFALASKMAEHFPTEGVAGEKLIKISELREDFAKLQKTGEAIKRMLDAHLAAVDDESLRTSLRPLCEEIKTELNINTLGRMADYLRLADDETMSADQKLALAISAWVLGSGSGTENLAVARSLFAVRGLVRQYLSSGRAGERDEILRRLLEQEGSTPNYLAKIIAHMKPPVETDEQPLEEINGLYKLSTPGLIGEPDLEYYVQLPPEYDPYRRYPCVVTLNGVGSTPLQQISWWAGDYNKRLQLRMGQAARHGYIVVAPIWAREAQAKYEYSAHEHAAVLYSMRDAMRRFSIDSDRVYLSGHSMGGDAAWDIGVAHPDVFAGVIPIVAVADRYVDLYWQNAKHVPFYFVMGEMDGDKLAQNGRSFQRYLTRPGYDVMMVEYQGRGHEHFHDEIQNLFDWMDRHKRDFFPREFDVAAMRPWDNYFWWAEIRDYPSTSMVSPVAWSSTRPPRAAITEGKILENNGVWLKTAGKSATIWLSPEMVDFDKRIYISGKARIVKPSAEVLLEDVRTRVDRQHPFWAKEEM